MALAGSEVAVLAAGAGLVVAAGVVWPVVAARTVTTGLWVPGRTARGMPTGVTQGSHERGSPSGSVLAQTGVKGSPSAIG
jgi:hypothetical protein